MCYMFILSILTNMEQADFAVKIINGTRKCTKIDRKKKEILLVSYRAKAHLQVLESQQIFQTSLVSS